MVKNYQIRGHLAAFFTIFVWGITYISTKVLLVSFTAIEIMFYRLLLAVIALFFISPPPGRKTGLGHLKEVVEGEWQFMLAGLCGVTLYFMFQNIALSLTLAANVGILISLAPLLVAILNYVFLRDRRTSGFYVGFALAMSGIILITYGSSMILNLNPLGDLLSIMAALSWAFYSIIIKNIKTPPNMVFGLTRKIFSYGLLFLLPFLPLFEFHIGWERLVDPPNLLNLLFLGVVASAVCFATWNFAIEALGPVRTSVYIYLGPVITILTSAIVLKETIIPTAGIGMALILAGMVLSEKEKVEHQKD